MLSLNLITSNAFGESQCSADFTESFVAKRKCVLFSDEASCGVLGLLGGMAIGGAAGAAAAKMYGSLVSKMGPEAERKFSEAVKVLKAERKLSDKAWEIKRAIQDQGIKQVSGGKYPDMKAYEKEANRIAKMPRGDEKSEKAQSHRELRQASDPYVESQMAIRRASEKDPELREALKGISKGAFDTFNPDRIAKKIQNIYPEEYAKVSKYYEPLNKLETVDWEKLNSRVYQADDPEYRSYVERHEKAKKELNDYLEKAPLKERIVGRFLQHGFSMRGFASHRRPLFATAKEDIRISKMSDKLNAKNRMMLATTSGAQLGIYGGAALALLPAAEGIREAQQGQDILKNCQSSLGLADDEVEYLQGTALWSSAKVRTSKVGSEKSDCGSLYLSNPVEAIKHFTDEKTEIPSGICKMLQNEDQNLNQLVGEVSSSSSLSCDSFSDANVKADFTAENNTKFTFVQSDYTATAAMIPGKHWPNFQTLKFMKSDGKTDRARQIAYDQQYNVDYSPSTMPANIDVIQRMKDCRTSKTVNCDMIQAAVRAQLATFLRGKDCKSSATSGAHEVKDAPAGTAR